VVVAPADRLPRGLGPREDLGEREVPVVALGHAEGVPRRDAVRPDVAGDASALQRLEGGLQPVVHRLAGAGRELGLRVVDVEAVDRVEPQSVQGAVERPLQVVGRDRVSAVRELVGVDDPAPEEAVADVRRRVGGALAVEREEPALRRHHDRVAVDRRVADRLADDALGPPAAVVDRGVDVVHAGAEREPDRLAVGVVDGGGRVAEVSPDPDAGGHPGDEPPEVRAPEGVAELVAVGPERVAGRHVRPPGGAAAGKVARRRAGRVTSGSSDDRAGSRPASCRTPARRRRNDYTSAESQF
jgi:hypothetical protein